MKRIFTGLLILYVLTMIVLAVMPSSPTSAIAKYDKSIHLIEFFVLAVLFIKTMEFYSFKGKSIFILFVLAVLIVASEVVQLFIPSRSFSYKDMIFDGIGVGMAVFSKWIFTKRLL